MAVGAVRGWRQASVNAGADDAKVVVGVREQPRTLCAPGEGDGREGEAKHPERKRAKGDAQCSISSRHVVGRERERERACPRAAASTVRAVRAEAGMVASTVDGMTAGA